MKEIDVSIKDEYYSQINNKYTPLSACMRTSMVMMLIYNGVRFVEAGKSPDLSKPFIIYPKAMQPEDYLSALCESPWGYELRDSVQWAKGIPPGQVHYVLERIVNGIVGKDVDQFLTTKDENIIYGELKSGRAVMVTGQFTASGHAVCVCGMRYDEDTNTVSDILVDDPFGNYLTKYADIKGNNVWLPVEVFLALWSGNLHKYIGG
jgi:hypothetical protein